jgi:hypothetical protein
MATVQNRDSVATYHFMKGEQLRTLTFINGFNFGVAEDDIEALKLHPLFAEKVAKRKMIVTESLPDSIEDQSTGFAVAEDQYTDEPQPVVEVVEGVKPPQNLTVAEATKKQRKKTEG